MKRKNRKKINAKTKEPKRKNKTVSALFIFIILGGLAGGIYLFCKKSGYFYVSEVEIRYTGGYDKEQYYENNINFLGLYEPINIFSINLKGLAENILSLHPEIETVNLRRRLPNRIVANIKMRKPVAQIKLSRYFPIDSSGVLLPGARNIPDENLPVLVGVDFSLRRNKIGDKIESKNLEKALLLIKGLGDYNWFNGFKVNTIDLVDSRNISIFMDNGIEVKVGDRDFGIRIEKLRRVLPDLPADLTGIKYIDLRFEDVVIGQK